MRAGEDGRAHPGPATAMTARDLMEHAVSGSRILVGAGSSDDASACAARLAAQRRPCAAEYGTRGPAAATCVSSESAPRPVGSGAATRIGVE
jgi:hypothetical protein